MNDCFEIDCNGYPFKLCFSRPGEWLEEFPSSVKRMIRVYFNPNGNLNEKQVLQIFSDSKPKLLEEIKKYIQDHSDEYDQFEIKYEFNEWGFNIDPSFGGKIVISFEARLNADFKRV